MDDYGHVDDETPSLAIALYNGLQSVSVIGHSGGNLDEILSNITGTI